MHYVYSTLSSDQDYALYPDKFDPKGIPQPLRVVHIDGKANVIDKHKFITPKGVVTEVTDQELKTLQSISAFQQHMTEGFIKVDEKKADPAKVAKADMTAKDRSAQLVEDDFDPNRKPLINSTQTVVKR